MLAIIPDEKASLSEFLPYRLAITSSAISHNIARHYRARFNLTISEWRVMAVIGDAGEQTQRDLVSATYMDKVAVNRACKVLVDRGLVQRSPNRQDGRSHLLDLTREGHAIYAEVMPLALEMESRLTASLTATERACLRRALDKLLTKAEELCAEDCDCRTVRAFQRIC